MTREIISEFRLADCTLRFVMEKGSARVGLEVFPTSLSKKLVARRKGLAGLPYIDVIPNIGNPPATVLDSLVQVKLGGDAYPGAFAQGHTMRNSASVDVFQYDTQHVDNAGGKTTVVTTLKSAVGHRIEHQISWYEGDAAAEVVTAFINESNQPVTLEMLSSFSLGGITPFHCADASGRLRVHRFRSVWSAEGRLHTQSIEQLHLERSWSGAGMFSERFGQVGSMPVRKWFPFVAVEDTEAGVLWGAQLAWAGSWQIEVFRQHDDVCISGGLADREFGHWMKRLAPGESLVTPPAFIACVHGDLDDFCDRLTAVQHRAADQHPAVERDLPVVFNEWCTTWGDPRHDKLVAIAQRLKESETRYLVIDAGWYKGASADWGTAHGDWIPNSSLFPDGLAATAAEIRNCGLIPGLWFEMETCGSGSAAFSLVDHLLKRDGIPLTVRERRFWDLNDPLVVDYLTERVIGLLKRCGFGYLKVDYNETLGIGCDGHESQGEGLRRQIHGVYCFFDRIRERLPDLVIESCSSGGHRLEPSMLGRTAMSSFSDAHELVEIPIIAAGLHRLMLPRQSQIWAVLRRSKSKRRLVYSLAATFLGRMCLSGEIAELSDSQWQIVLNAQRLYRAVALIIKHGTSRRVGRIGESWRHPEGWQAVVRTAVDGGSALVVLHTFKHAPEQVNIPLPLGASWRIKEQFGAGGPAATIRGPKLACPVKHDFSARIVWLLRR
ncbi:MAG TPA: glycoside hydrolase family 36 protein [Verrucomicrobiae bacterium]|nr:glycoside hydrolase family 36 protein [Verrucomicrobiae bacterium]